ETGVAVTYGLNNAQQRGRLFIEPGTQVYEGMIVGVNARDDDLVVNVCKEKKMTNMRSSTSDIATKLTPALRMSLEESIGFIAEDEMVEVTPGSTRLRKHIASNDARYRQSRGKSRALSLTGASSAERM
ncbi:MAG: translational GTPase TypA, partial [Dehalococcoidia bacterium]|nr:translational GTPase TypA [Dehalococcoidia bacterium]